MDWYLYILIPTAGLVCGFVNTLAGSGSLITLPVLLFAGLPPEVANGTNRVAILLQSVVGVRGFYRRRMLTLQPEGSDQPAWHGWVFRVLPALLGALPGAIFGTITKGPAMRLTIAGLLIVMLILLLIRPNRWLNRKADGKSPLREWVQFILFLCIGAYGGFIQAGVGQFLLAALVLGTGYDLLRANAIKVFLILCATSVALIVFAMQDEVRWGIGLLMASGNMIGAWFASRFAQDSWIPWVRRLLILMVVLAAAILLYQSLQVMI